MVVSVCGVAGLVSSGALALADSSSPAFPVSSTSAEESGPSTALGDSLVVPGVQSLDEGQQLRAQEQARLANPEAVAAREQSRTRFAGLDAAQAAKLAAEAFPRAVALPGGGPPALPAGQKATGFVGDNAERVELAGGRHAVIESFEPIDVQGPGGRRVPIDLSLVASDDSFQPATPLVGVSIPKRLSSGVTLSGVGVSLTPVDRAGSALGGSEGAIDGASVLYANTQTDSDTLVKPVTAGLEADTVLRSVQSPQRLYFKVGLPAGARLVQSAKGSGPVRVLAGGAVLAVVLAPSAVDAAGTIVPVSMSVSGDTLSVDVPHASGDYQYPIIVDPTVADKELGEVSSNWAAETDNPAAFSFVGGGASIEDFDRTSVEYQRGQWGAIAYETHGESHIYGFISETGAGNAGSNVEETLSILSGHHGAKEEEFLTEAAVVMPDAYAQTAKELCVEAGCATGKVKTRAMEESEGVKSNDANVAEFKQTATNVGDAFGAYIATADVEILQEKGPAVSFDTTDKTLPDGAPNAAYPGIWAGPTARLRVTATDPGVGITTAIAPWLCKGVQCPETLVNEGREGGQEQGGVSGDPNGEDTIENTATDSVGLTATAKVKVKVDNSAPYDVTLSGLPAKKELGNGATTLKASAKDGTSIESSGIESLVLTVDGQPVGKPSGSCSPGPCTANGEWTVSGGEFPAGQHKFAVVATSYAGDVAKSEEYTEDTGHPALPVALGPGSVSPETGEFYLNATDVAIGGPGGGLSLKRSYSSSHLTAGAEGPLGPQWSMSVGGSESLTKGAEGSVVLTGGEGQQSVFTSKGKGEFTSPPLSASLTLTEVGSEFVLKDASGTVTKFKLPSGGTGNTYVPATLEGPDATNVVTYAFKTTAGITEPTELLAPVPTGVSCTAELAKGCRALGFVYDTKTTATGNGAGEWGEYEGRLKEVTFTAWEPKEGKMKTTAVADYVYDREGRLRGEWDPRVSPALETTYGYDAAGHVTAATPPGQQPWLFDYGTATGDPRARIVSVTRPGTSTASGDGVAPVNTVAPAMSTTHPRVGVPMSVSNGTWSNSPLTYSYQWETCGDEDKRDCSPIEGATSQTFTPTAEEHSWFSVTVTASNADGATSAQSSNQTTWPLPGITFKESLSFGKEGSSEGQVKEAAAIAAESASSSEGNVWVADTGNSRVEEFSSAGKFVKTFGWDVDTGGKAEFEVCTSSCKAGTAGSGNGQFERPVGIALSENDKYVYVSDAGNKRIEIFEAKTGKYVSQYAVPSTGVPAGIAIGRLWTTEPDGTVSLCIALSNSTVKCPVVLAEGAELGTGYTFGGVGSTNGKLKEPADVAISEEGNRYGEGNQVFVTDKGNHRVEIFEPNEFETRYIGQFGTEGSGEGQFLTPEGIALGPKTTSFTALQNAVLVTDAGNKRVQQTSQTGENPLEWSWGSGQQAIAVSSKSGTGDGTVYVVSAAVTGTARIAKWVPEAPTIKAPEPPTPGTSAVETVEYHVPVSGTGAPYAMGKTEVEAWGQKDDPTEATAIFPPDEPMAWPAKDYKRATIIYLDASSRAVNAATPGGAITTTEYDSQNDVERSLSADSREAALKAGSKSAEVSKELDTENTYNGEGTELLSTVGPKHTIQLPNGTHVEARHHTTYSYNEGAPAEGGPYGLPTKTTEGAEYSGKEEDIRETTTSYSGQSNLGWKLHKPTSVTTDPKGLKLTSTTVYQSSTGEVTETKTPKGTSEGTASAHDTKTIYYTAAANSEYPSCGGHAEWANLPCETLPAKQPETAGIPNLPVTTTTYNMWDEPEKTTETVGTATRTSITTYDAEGRPKTSATSSTVGTALPTITDEYNEKTGAEEKSCANEGKPCSEGKPKTITSVLNSLGELTSYTDADENTSTYEYDIDGRITKTSDGKGTQTYTYEATTGDLTKLVDSAAGTFTATYDVEGNMLSEGLPNGMSKDYTYNQTGTPVSLEYVKTTHCTEKCTWFSDNVAPSIHGQWAEQTSTLSHQAYTYDADGRLTQVQNTSAAKCTTRVYAYEEETNRTSLKTYEPNSKGECATEHDSEEKHSYDIGNRLTDTGVRYNEFGDTTALPAADAGGSELTSTFYVDNQLASETQNGETVGFNLDPSGRARETVSTGKTSQDIINHYAGGGSAPAWTVETPSGNWTRYVHGIGSGLVAIQVNGATPVLQLSDLHGDIVATAALSETETKLLSTTDASEFGVPTTSTPAKYSWQGAEQQPTELASGEIDMGARSYIPQLGRFLQPDPIPGGSANAYAYTFGDPVNTSDPSGEFTYGFSSWLSEANNQQAQEVAAREVARESLERAEAERRAAEARADAPKMNWEEEYAMGGPSLLEQIAAKGESIGGGEEEEGGGGGGGSFVASAARFKAKICHNHEVPGDPDQGCCIGGRQVESGTVGSSVCDPEQSVPSPPANGHARSKKHYCPPGEELGVGLWGVEVCKPEGNRDEKEENDPEDG
ncbi:MAG TPA: RHS repeat-associated core domain-containing protein [Solirubrobacteraceae bacterium]|nr:RHS repeat-associated core domain-containing protein [Solirubrobacteraceae bacterium]